MNGREAIPLSVKLGMMADRAIFELYCMQSPNESREKINREPLRKAAQFIENAQQGRALIQGLVVGKNAVETTSAFSQVLATLEAIYANKTKEEKARISKEGLDAFFATYIDALKRVLEYVEGARASVNPQDIQKSLEFFKNLRKVALTNSAGTPEIVVLPKGQSASKMR